MRVSTSCTTEASTRRSISNEERVEGIKVVEGVERGISADGLYVDGFNGGVITFETGSNLVTELSVTGSFNDFFIEGPQFSSPVVIFRSGSIITIDTPDTSLTCLNDSYDNFFRYISFSDILSFDDDVIIEFSDIKFSSCLGEYNSTTNSLFVSCTESSACCSETETCFIGSVDDNDNDDDDDDDDDDDVLEAVTTAVIVIAGTGIIIGVVVYILALGGGGAAALSRSIGDDPIISNANDLTVKEETKDDEKTTDNTFIAARGVDTSLASLDLESKV